MQTVLILLAFLLMLPVLVTAEEAQTRKEVYHGYLHPKDRYHYDLHEIRAGEHVRISLTNVSGNLDPFLRVSLGKFSVEDDDSGAGSDAVVQFVAPQNGTYDIEIFPYKDATFGEYALTVERTSTDALPAGSLATLDIERSHPSLAVQELRGSLEAPGDFYEHELVHLKAGHTLYIFAESLTPGLEVEVLIKDFQRKVLSDVLPDTKSHM
ncbi:MAG: PPC domain-containing protein, partial [Betaproteobacteria bacterium]